MGWAGGGGRGGVVVVVVVAVVVHWDATPAGAGPDAAPAPRSRSPLCCLSLSRARVLVLYVASVLQPHPAPTRCANSRGGVGVQDVLVRGSVHVPQPASAVLVYQEQRVHVHSQVQEAGG